MLEQTERTIKIGKFELKGLLQVPDNAKGIVLFAHGSGSSRFSPRNQYVAEILIEGGLGTLLVDLFTPDEERVDIATQQLRFDISFLARRVCDVTEWLYDKPDLQDLEVCYFGSSTGAAAALVSAAHLGTDITAVVSRGGRPDLAAGSLPQVKSPTLFIVGGNDNGVIELNNQAFELLECEKEIHIVPGATHLFEEEGTLEEVAQVAKKWFIKHLS